MKRWGARASSWSCSRLRWVGVIGFGGRDQPNVRVATAQPRTRCRLRLTNSMDVLARVEKNLEALEVIVHKAGARR
jgi:hypothetical protein